MKRKDNILINAKQIILTESQAIANLSKLLTENFVNSVNCIHKSNGRVILTGVGKSANIATKITSTLNSTGTPAVFMHAADAVHGDLGTIEKKDIVICLSKSGNTSEIKVLVPLIKKFGNKIIAITANSESFLAKNADFFINSFVEKEACPNNLAPTTSTTAQLVLGDALAVCLLNLKGFSSSDFAKYHPGGALGKRLYLRVIDLVQKNKIPKINIDTNLKEAIIEITEKRLGATAVMDENKLVGIITDGDIRRALTTQKDIYLAKAKDIMTLNPKTICVETMAIDALNIMEELNITQLLVTQQNDYVGIIHLHDLIKEGVY